MWHDVSHLMRAYFEQLKTIPGWFGPADVALFKWLLATQTRDGVLGDLAELGVYHGKSAILIGLQQQPGEAFTVCDLFGGATDPENHAENEGTYRGLSRRHFEDQYTRFVPTLPTIVEGLTSTILQHVGSGRHRFVHIDASHLYEHVTSDLDAAHQMLLPQGIVACDDWRTEHCPGVAAAVWEAVLTKNLRPICATGAKFYGTWGDPEPWRHKLIGSIGAHPELQLARDIIRGDEFLRVFERPIPAPVQSTRRRLATSLLPPVLLHRVDRRRGQ